jgi:hypothetical protein
MWKDMGEHTLKTCKQCKEEKDLTAFQKDCSKKDGLRPECKQCTSINRKNTYNFETRRKHELNRKYKDGHNEYLRLHEKQNGKCAICGCAENGRYKSLSVDHCHDTGKIRGLLCNNCNRGIGLLQDSCKVVENALQYLKEHK